MTAEELLKVWAAKRLNIEPSTVREVGFHSEYWKGCSTCGNYGIEHDAEVWLTNGRYRSFPVQFDANLINEIMTAGAE